MTKPLKDYFSNISIIKFSFLVSLIFIYISFGLVTYFTANYHYDEILHHSKNVKLFSEKGVEAIVSEEYSSANTPLPYLIPALITSLFQFHPEIKHLRLFNLITSFILILLLFIYYKPFNSNPLLLFILFFYPHYLKNTFGFFMGIYGLLFFILTLIFYQREGEINKFLSGLFLSFAILSQQYYLPIFFFLIFNEIFSNKIYKQKIVNITLISISMLFPAFLFFIWEGFTHINFVEHSIRFSPVYVTAIFASIGFIFAPVVLQKILSLPFSLKLLIFILTLILTIFYWPEFQNVPEYGKI